jgi:hypothetical protein
MNRVSARLRMKRGVARLTIPLVVAGALSVTLFPATAAAVGFGGNPSSLTLQIPGSSVASFQGNFNLGPSFANGTLNAVAAPPVSAQPAGALARVLVGAPPVKRPSTAATVTLATSLTVETPTGSVIGKDVAITAVLRDRLGHVLPDEHVALALDGTEVRSDKTDATGSLTLTIPGKKLDTARDYAILVTFGGSHGYAPSSKTATLTILAAAIQIQTVPALPNMRFTLGTETGTTGPDGVTAVPVPKSGAYQLAADLNPGNSPTATVKASFVRWLDNVYTADRTIDVSGPATYVIGLRVAYRASVRYVDLDGNPVDPTLIQQAQFSTGTGTDDVVLNSQTGAQDVWWTSSTTIHVATMLIPSQVTYRVLSVKIHGTDVVNRGQQAWTPTESGVWTVQLLLYGMTVEARDAVFGTPVSGQLKLTYPDGVAVEQHVSSDGKISFVNLPRGQYQLAMSPAAFSPPTPVALSKAQAATLRVITYADVILWIAALVLVVVLLAVIGRWSLIHARIRRRSRRAAPDAAS